MEEKSSGEILVEWHKGNKWRGRHRGGDMTAQAKYKIEDLHIGMRVYKEELSDIYDTRIILYRPKQSDMKEDGIIGFVGKEPNTESDALYTSDNIIVPIFNDSIDLEDDVFYDE